MSDAVQICEYHGREFVWIAFKDGWGRGGRERYSLAQAEEIDGPLKPMDYIGTAPQILGEMARLRQELDEARAGQNRLVETLVRQRKLVQAAEAERDCLLDVYRAAEAWVTAPFAAMNMRELSGDLVDAVDAYRSATPDAEPAPTSRAFKLCACGHPWIRHEIEEYDGDGSDLCCVEGCDRVGCPGRAAVSGPVPGEDDEVTR